MRLFRRSSDDTPSPAAEHEAAARAALRGDSDPRAALGHLRSGFAVDPAHRTLYALAAESLRQLGGENEALLFEQALARFDTYQPFFELGYHFIEVGNDALAVPFLERAHALAPTDVPTATELALAVTAQFRPCRGREVLAKTNYTSSFSAAYQYHWCSLLCEKGEAETAEFIDGGRNAVRTGGVPAQWASEVTVMLDKLDACRERMQAIGKPEPFVRDWHFIQYGAAVLDFFDERSAEEGLSVAGGRYVYQSSDAASLYGILERLGRFLEILQRRPAQVLYVADRDSEIVGRAVAAVLGLPVDVATAENVAGPHRLIVASDNHALADIAEALLIPHEAQTVFSLVMDWLEPGVLTPDISGVMAQHFVLPWQSGLRIDPDTRQAVRTEPDTRPAAEIAAELLSAEPTPDPRFERETLPFYQRLRTLLKGVREGDRRLRFSRDSPVPGAYFM